MIENIAQGEIKWYDHVKAYGFIINANDEGDIFFHLTSVNGIDYENLQPGTPVEYTVAKGKKARKEANKVWLQITPRIRDTPDLIATILLQNDSTYNTALLTQLLNGIPKIDNQTAYEQVTQLLKYGKAAQISADLIDRCFHFASAPFRLQFWLDGLFEYCDIAYLSDVIKTDPPSLKKQIEEKLHSSALQIKGTPPKALFQNIQAHIIHELRAANKHIRVAVAWFTHELQFNALMEKLRDGVKVELLIINDYINNWPLGLPFKDFVDAGGKLYMAGPERIMHHKFALIDDNVLMNGSYNWTYYAEEKNQENCLFYYNDHQLIHSFSAEFDILISQLEAVQDVLPPPFTPDRYDLFGRRMYLSLDLQYKAVAFQKTKRKVAIRLLQEAIQIDPTNEQAQVLIRTWHPTESDLKIDAIHRSQNYLQNELSRRQNLARTLPTPVVTDPQTQTTAPANPNVSDEAQRSDGTVADLQAMLAVTESLKTRNFEGNRGKLRINLTWYTKDDLDLHVFDPDNNEIYYSSKTASCQGHLGQLDRDANASDPRTDKPQENIYWESGPPKGNYLVMVVHYSRQQLSKVPFAVTIIPDDDDATVVTGITNFTTAKIPLKIAEMHFGPTLGLVVTPLNNIPATL